MAGSTALHTEQMFREKRLRSDDDSSDHHCFINIDNNPYNNNFNYEDHHGGSNPYLERRRTDIRENETKIKNNYLMGL